MKELLYEIVESNTGRNVNQTFDVHIIDKDPVFNCIYLNFYRNEA